MTFLGKASSWPFTSACLLGALSALGFAPLFWWPISLLAFSMMWHVYVLSLQSWKDLSPSSQAWKAARLGWGFGLSHFVVGLYWITNALTVDLSSFWWLIPFSLFGLPSLLALFIALPFGLAALAPPSPIGRALIFSALWGLSEWLRGHLFTGFPWNLLGYVWGGSLEISQSASLGGVYGLTLFTLLVALSLAYSWQPSWKSKLPFCLMCLAGGLLWLWGQERLSTPVPPSSLAIRLVQPNISQTLKWDPAHKNHTFQKLLSLTKRPSAHPLSAIIWPESALSFFLEDSPPARQVIAAHLPLGALLFTGGLRRTPPGQLPLQVWNSLLVLDTQGNLVVSYDKSHLVPFGEYLPYRTLADQLFGPQALKKVTAGALDFTPGAGPQSLILPGKLPPFSGLVCYEVIFPRSVICPTSPRPSWIVNVTNDAWYGNSSGPYQHLQQAQFRAIEEGLPVVRAANSGISAVFDGYGRPVASLPLNTEGILDTTLPPPLLCPPPYALWGDVIPFSLIFLLLLGGLRACWRQGGRD